MHNTTHTESDPRERVVLEFNEALGRSTRQFGMAVIELGHAITGLREALSDLTTCINHALSLRDEEG